MLTDEPDASTKIGRARGLGTSTREAFDAMPARRTVRGLVGDGSADIKLSGAIPAPGARAVSKPEPAGTQQHRTRLDDYCLSALPSESR